MISITPRDYQQKIFETAKNRNTLVVLPTGLGKTLIALLLAIERLKKHPGSKILFLAPTSPLAEQHYAYFTKYLPELFADLQLFIEIRVLLKRIWDSKVSILKSKNYLVGPANKITLLKLQARLAMQVSRRNFAAMHGMSLTAQAIKISHALELLETQTLSGLNEYFNSLIKQAYEKKSKAVQSLVLLPEFNAARISLNYLLTKKVEHPKIEELAELAENEFSINPQAKIIVFTQFRDTASVISRRLSQITPIKSAIFVGQAKKKDTGLSQKEQKQIIEKFKSGEINVLISTSIAEEGLDIPEVNEVIFYEPIPSAIRTIQRAGRTEGFGS